jgi:hypothetical protein
LFSDPHKTHEYTVWAECRICTILPGGAHGYHWCRSAQSTVHTRTSSRCACSPCQQQTQFPFTTDAARLKSRPKDGVSRNLDVLPNISHRLPQYNIKNSSLTRFYITFRHAAHCRHLLHRQTCGPQSPSHKQEVVFPEGKQARFLCCTKLLWDTRWHSWLRHCATSRKVAGSIPDGVIHWIFIYIILPAAL